MIFTVSAMASILDFYLNLLKRIPIILDVNIIHQFEAMIFIDLIVFFTTRTWFVFLLSVLIFIFECNFLYRRLQFSRLMLRRPNFILLHRIVIRLLMTPVQLWLFVHTLFFNNRRQLRQVFLENLAPRCLSVADQEIVILNQVYFAISWNFFELKKEETQNCIHHNL